MPKRALRICATCKILRNLLVGGGSSDGACAGCTHTRKYDRVTTPADDPLTRMLVQGNVRHRK